MSKDKTALRLRVLCALVTALALFLDYAAVGIAQMLCLGGVQGLTLTAGIFLLYSWADRHAGDWRRIELRKLSQK